MKPYLIIFTVLLFGMGCDCENNSSPSPKHSFIPKRHKIYKNIEEYFPLEIPKTIRTREREKCIVIVTEINEVLRGENPNKPFNINFKIDMPQFKEEWRMRGLFNDKVRMELNLQRETKEAIKKTYLKCGWIVGIDVNRKEMVVVDIKSHSYIPSKY